MPVKMAPQKKLAIFQDIMAGQEDRKALAAKHGINISALDGLRTIYKRRGTKTLKELAGLSLSTGKPVPSGKWGKFRDEIQRLKDQGYARREIADKLHVPGSIVSYYTGLQTSPTTGGTSNGILNKNFVVGIAYAETERFVAHLSQRLALPTNFLRQRLSELLGRSPLRGARGDEDQVPPV